MPAAPVRDDGGMGLRIMKHRAQLINYLKATGYKLGLLVNFGHYPQLEYVRIVR